VQVGCPSAVNASWRAKQLTLMVQPCWSPGGLNTNACGSPVAAVGSAGGAGCRRVSRRRRHVGSPATRSAAHHRWRVVGRVRSTRRRTHKRLCQVAPRDRHPRWMPCSGLGHQPFWETRAIHELTVSLDSSSTGVAPPTTSRSSRLSWPWWIILWPSRPTTAKPQWFLTFDSCMCYA